MRSFPIKFALKIPYGASSTTERKPVSDRWRATAARVRSVTSRFMMTKFSGSPLELRITLAVDSRTRHVPSLWRKRYSIGRPTPVRRASSAASLTHSLSSGWICSKDDELLNSSAEYPRTLSYERLL